MSTLQFYLNELAGTTGLDEKGAANAYAGTSGKGLQGALNTALGTTGVGVQACLNRLAGTNGLGVAAAAGQILPKTSRQLWFDAGNVNGVGVAQPAADAAVSSWKDLSGNNRHAVQATGTKQPLFKPAGLSTGLPSLLFDGTDDFLTTTFTSGLTAASIYIVSANAAPGAGAVSEIMLGGTQGGTGRFGLGLDSAGGVRFRFFDGGAPTLDTTTNGPVVPAAEVGGVYSLVWASSVAHMRVNNGTVYDSTTANSTVIGDGASWSIGHYDLASGAFAWNGDICSVVVYSVAHSATTRALIERRLGRRFRVTVA